MVSRAPLENHDLRFPKRQHLPSGGWASIQNPQVLGATQLSLAWRWMERRVLWWGWRHAAWDPPSAR